MAMKQISHSWILRPNRRLQSQSRPVSRMHSISALCFSRRDEVVAERAAFLGTRALGGKHHHRNEGRQSRHQEAAHGEEEEEDENTRPRRTSPLDRLPLLSLSISISSLLYLFISCPPPSPALKWTWETHTATTSTSGRTATACFPQICQPHSMTAGERPSLIPRPKSTMPGKVG